MTVLIGAAIDLFTPKYSNEATGVTVSSFILNLFVVVFLKKGSSGMNSCENIFIFFFVKMVTFSFLNN